MNCHQLFFNHELHHADSLYSYSSLIVCYIASVSCLLHINELNDVAAQHVIFLLSSVT